MTLRRAATAIFCGLSFVLSGCDSGGLFGSDGRIYQGGKHFGRAISLDGDRALVAAEDSDEAFVIRRSGGGWVTEARLRPPDTLPTDAYFGRSVALDGDVAVVGAPIFGEATSTPPGRVYIYERTGAGWSQTAELFPPARQLGERYGFFGRTVSVSNGRIAVGIDAYKDRSGQPLRPAAAVIYERVGGTWSEQTRVEETELSPEGRSEASANGIALDGTRLAVSSPFQDVGGVKDAGVVRVYEPVGTSESATSTLSAPDPREGDLVGEIVALDGPLLAVAARARRAAASGLAVGSAFVFRNTGGGWVFESELRPPGQASFESYGFALDADGDRVAVGAAGRAGTRGSVFVWVRRPSGAWELEAELWPKGLGPGSGFGEDVAIDGDRLLGGAIGVENYEGGVYEFRRAPDGWVQVFD